MGSLEHKKALQKGAGIKVVLALVLGSFAFILPAVVRNSSFGPVGLLFMVVAVVLYYWGLGQSSISKGYSGIMAVCGILGLIGLIILLILPDKYQLAAPPVMEGAYPRPAPGTVTTIV